MSILAHQFQSRSVRVEFGTEVSSSVLDSSAYQIVVNTVDSSEPLVESVSYYDSTHTSVILHLSGGLTVGSQYTLHTAEFEDSQGEPIASSSYNFVGTVSDKPKVIGAFLSIRSHIDIVFDRPVGQYSPAASAVLNADPSGGSGALSLIEWSDSIPETTLRFEYVNDFDPGSVFFVDFENVCDSSFNVTSGSARLAVSTRSGEELGYDDISRVQVTDAWMESYNPALGKVYFNVAYNVPLTQSDANNVSSYSLDIPTSHVDADIVNVPESDAVDNETLLSLAEDLKEKFNKHIADGRVHLNPAEAKVKLDKLIRLTNDLWKYFNAHIVNTDLHVASDAGNATTVRRANSLDSCVTLLNNLQAKYNAHIQSASHIVTDPYAMSDWPESTDIVTMADYADEMRFRMQMHFSPPFHPDWDYSIRAVGFCQEHITHPWVFTVQDAATIAVTLQHKLAAHAVNKTHIYPDVYNGIRPITYVVGGDSAGAISALNLVRGRYFDHIALYKNIEVTEVYANLTDDEQTIENNESSYQIQYSVDFPGQPESHLTFYAAVTTPGEAEQTNPENFTGQIKVRSLFEAPKLLQSYSTPGKLTLKFDKELSTPRLQDIHLRTDSNQALRVVSVELSSSAQALYFTAQRLAHALTFHSDESLGAIHKVVDTVNFVDPDEFLGGTMDGVYNCLNELKAAFNAHAVDLTFHEGIPSSFTVSTADASDPESAIRLAADLFVAIREHNLDGAHHSAPGRDVLLGKLFDTLVIYHDEVANGTECIVEASLPYLVRQPGGSDKAHPFTFETSFVASSDPPILAAAIPRSGLSVAAEVPTLVRDRVDLYFSKPMLPNPLSSGNVELSPSVGVGNIFWTGDHTATIEVSGTTSSTQYDITVSDVRDKSGNSIE